MPNEQPDETEVEGYSVFEDADESTEQTTEREETPASLEAGHDRGCPKCGHEETVTDEISTTGSGFSKFFDIQNRRFTVIVVVETGCTPCGRWRPAPSALAATSHTGVD